MTFLLRVTALAVVVSADPALVVGDSWAEYSGQTLADQCESISSVVNVGVAGTTAAQWANNDPCCSLADVSFNDTFRTAWVSVGGNDFFLKACTQDASELNVIQTNIAKVVAQLQDLAPGTKIVLTGYSVPSGPLTWLPYPACSEIRALEHLNLAVKGAAEAQNVEYVDVSYVMGGNLTSWSDAEYYRDSIHLNAAGYQLLWNYPPLQEAMQCTAEPISGAMKLLITWPLAMMVAWMRL